jgi:hypothetical protein
MKYQQTMQAIHSVLHFLHFHVNWHESQTRKFTRRISCFTDHVWHTWISVWLELLHLKFVWITYTQFEWIFWSHWIYLKYFTEKHFEISRVYLWNIENMRFRSLKNKSWKIKTFYQRKRFYTKQKYPLIRCWSVATTAVSVLIWSSSRQFLFWITEIHSFGEPFHTNWLYLGFI